ncbi:MAG: exonuclease SbcCD subunit D C-terminal domain-containing protein [Zoogloeaceae bacterium]|jgi:exonuclease SbcD|nr:exonuclease SbcCD subunit D C-terminal domain-containing protein [Zoogloeaceae bacterium]
MLTLLHTSDWHLGRTLHGRKRHEEFDAFLDWLADTMRQANVDILIVAGDVFDTATPTNRAQASYYRFLRRVAAGVVCRHVVIVAGNHDSPSFLDAPRDLLKALDVHVIGRKRDDPADEVLLLTDAQGMAEAVVCATPYLRDKDLREVEAGESVADKEVKRLAGLRAHYATVAKIATARRGELDIPIIATGHLFTDGGKTVEGDGVRELYVGSLARVPLDLFPANLDYLALGHLHMPQTVGGCEHIRYSGAPLAMGFAEAGQAKSVCRVEFHGRTPRVDCIPVPVFRTLARVEGDWPQIARRLAEIKAQSSASVWLEIVHDGEERIGDLRKRLEEIVAGTALDVLSIKNPRLLARLMASQREEALEDLSLDEVFARCLLASAVPETAWPALRHTYQEACLSLLENDTRAE